MKNACRAKRRSSYSGGAFGSAVCIAGLCQTGKPTWLRLLVGVGSVFGLWCVVAGIRGDISVRRVFRCPR